MKKAFLIFVIFILEFFTFQNSYSEEPRIIKGVNPLIRRYVLWKVYTQPLDSNTEMYVTVDSVLKTDSIYKDFYIKEKFRIPKRAEEENKLKSNTYYIVLAMAAYEEQKKNFFLFVFDILPDTPENRKMLSEKWDNTKVIYDNSKPKPYIKGKDIDL